MPAVIEAVYENGVLKPLAGSDLKNHQHYRLIVLESLSGDKRETVNLGPGLAAEIERRTTILSDGRKIIRLSGLFNADLGGVSDDSDPVTDALAELRQERARHFDEQWSGLGDVVKE